MSIPLVRTYSAGAHSQLVVRQTYKEAAYGTIRLDLQCNNDRDLESCSVTFKITGYSWNRSADYTDMTGDWVTVVENVGPGYIYYPASGVKSISVSVTGSIEWDGGGTEAVNASGTFALDPVTPAVVPTVPVLNKSAANLGEAVQISLDAQDAVYKHDLTYVCGGGTGTIATNKTEADSPVSWTVPTSLTAYIVGKSETCRIICTTKRADGTVIGTAEQTLTVSVPETGYNPSVTASAAPVSGLSGQYVQGKSKAAFTITATAVGAAGITNIQTTIGGKVYSGASFQTDVLQTAGTVGYTIKATDSRGNSTTINGSITVQSYAAPSVEIQSCVRGSVKTNITVQFAYRVSAINQTKTYKIYSKPRGQSTWTQKASGTLTANTGTITQTLALTVDGYTIRVDITDSYTTVSATFEVASASGEILAGNGSGGIGIGMLPQGNNRVDIAEDTYIHGAVHVVDENGTVRATLSESGLQFYDTSGIARRNYPAI